MRFLSLTILLLASSACVAETPSHLEPLCLAGDFDGGGTQISVNEELQLSAPERPMARWSPDSEELFPDGNSVIIQGDTLKAKVVTGGGCFDRTYQLHWDGTFDQSEGTRVSLELTDSAEGCANDCAAVVRREPEFDLGPLKEAFQAEFGLTASRITVLVDDRAAVDYVIPE